MTMHYDSGSRHDFPRLARESGFSFNLCRGRVDWSQIGAVNVDRIVRERDLETLQGLFAYVMSCNLSSEYDLKVLDPNFIKIFQLAQLSTDFLLYCRNYLDHCVSVMQEQLRVALQEIERLQKERLQSTEVINHLRKKLKATSKTNNLAKRSAIFSCGGCKKMFVGEQYLLAHQQRRHPDLPASETLTKTNNLEVESLQRQVQDLQDRLHATESALKEKENSCIPDIATLQALLQNELQRIKVASGIIDSAPLCKETKELNSKDLEQRNLHSLDIHSDPLNEKHQSAVEIEDKTLSLRESNELLKRKYEAAEAAFLAQFEMQNSELKALREQLHEQRKVFEITMDRKLEEMQSQHQSYLDELRLSITESRRSGDHVSVASESNTESNAVPVGNLPQSSSPKLGAPQTVSGRSIPSQSFKGLRVKEPSETSPVILSLDNVKAVPHKNEDVLQAEYISPSEQDSSESSQSLSSNTVSPPLTIKGKEPNEGFETKNQVEDAANRSQCMYRKSTTSSSSDAGSSSCDSDSQSLSSELQQCSSGSDIHHSRLHLTSSVIDGLKNNLLGLLNQRLQELGVDPEWTGLPAASFHSNMATVKHHQNIAAKKQASYFQIQEKLIKELDRRVVQRLKLQQPSQNSTEKSTKKRKSGSFSIFARIKSHVKNKFSQSGHSASSAPIMTLNSSNCARMGNLVENVYSQEPSSTVLKYPHEYEIQQEISASVTNTSLNPSVAKERTSEKSAVSNNTAEFSMSLPPNSVDLSSENPSANTKAAVSDLRVYSRSMYANLNKSDIEVDGIELTSESAKKPPSQLRTSTPIETKYNASSTMGEHKAFVASDIESISEFESDVNDGEKSSMSPTVLQNPRNHTTLTTAELLANVAKFRQSHQQSTINSTVVKSNLKSSLSTGSITKKKVVFRDEKDGFNTIELGPALSSLESLTPQRSFSENSLSAYSGAPTDYPVAQPRSSLISFSTSTVPGPTNFDRDGDWDWDKDSSDSTLISKKSQESSEMVSLDEKYSSWRGNSVPKDDLSSSATNTNKVSDIVKDIEVKLQKEGTKPSFMINTAGSGTPPNPLSRSSPSVFGKLRFGNTGVSTSTSNINKNDNENILSDLQLDDISSS